MVRRAGKTAVAVVLAIAAVAFARPVHAHAVGLSRGEYTLVGRLATIKLTFARGDVEGLEAETLLRNIFVSSNGEPCSGALDEWAPLMPDAVALRAHFTCREPAAKFAVQLSIFGELAEGHRHAAHLQAGTRADDDVLYRSHDVASLALGEAAAVPPRSIRTRPGPLGMVQMGAEHVLTGYDHLVFLFGLALTSRRPRALLSAVSAFTVAHSATLAVAALGLWAPPPRAIEPAIALSIVYVGVENLFLHGVADKRWRITFPFGLLHGFGFAGALREIALPPAHVPWALLSFNAGVEVGQLMAMAALLPLLGWLRRSRDFAEIGVRALSAATVAAGAFWFVARVVHVAL
jgi:hypothetical protein